jgi:hypothetical protein
MDLVSYIFGGKYRGNARGLASQLALEEALISGNAPQPSQILFPVN